MYSDNLTSADNQQERLDAYLCRESSETIRRTPWETAVKRWSDLHGDMQSQAEMTWPPSRRWACRWQQSVGPYPVQP